MRIPALQTVGVLCGQLLARTRRHADHQRHAELTARHVPDRGGGIHDLIQRQQAEVDGHHLDDRAHASGGRADAGTDKTGFAERGVADPVLPEFVHQPL